MIDIETASQVLWPRRLYGSAAAIVNAEPALQQAAQLLVALAWAPSQVLTPAAARLAVFAWFWVAAEAPALMVSAAKPCEESIPSRYRPCCQACCQGCCVRNASPTFPDTLQRRRTNRKASWIQPTEAILNVACGAQSRISSSRQRQWQ